LPLRLLRPDGTVLLDSAGEDPLIVGSGPDADLRFDDPALATEQARIARVGGRYRLVDLAGGDGVAVNGRSVSQVMLAEGDLLRFGGVEVRVALIAAGVGASAATEAPQAEVQRAPEVVAAVPAVGRAAKAWWAAAAVVALVAAGVALSSAESPEAKAAFARAESAEAAGDFVAAAHAFGEAAKGKAGARFLAEATRRKGAAEASARRRAEAEALLRSIVAEAAAGDLAVNENRLRAAARPYLDVLPPQAIEAEIVAFREARRRRSAADATREAGEVDAFVRAGRFGDAVRSAERAASVAGRNSDDAATIAAAKRRAEEAAQEGVTRLFRETAESSAVERRARWVRGRDAYEGTIAGAELAHRLSEIEEALRVEAVVARKANVEEATVASRPATRGASLAAADEAMAVRDFERAASAYAEVAAAGEGSDAERARKAGARAATLAAFKKRLIAVLEADKSKLRGVKLGAEMSGALSSVDDDYLEFDLGGGARVRWSWARLDGERFAAVLARLGLRPEDERASAEWWLASGDAPRALDALARAAAADPAGMAEATPLVAEARGVAAPAAGFVLFEGRFLTHAEEAEARLAAEIASLSREAAEAPVGAWESAAARLRALGDRGAAAAVSALHARTDANRKRVVESPVLKGAALTALRAKLFEELQRARKEAFVLVLDEKRYPYPYAENQKEIQAEVDRLVDAVRTLWERPSRRLFVVVAGEPLDADVLALAALDADQAKSAAAARSLGGAESADAVRTEIDRLVELSAYAPDARTQSLLDDAKEIEAWNATQTAVIGTFEREVHRLTNAYRLMMGRRPLMIDDRLVRCARGHSEEMSALGYFDHHSPTPGRNGPSDRARLAGWGGGVSENIAWGSPTPAAAVNGWIGSSGHHRNLLVPGHTHLGVGYAPKGHYWTQNFGKGALKPPK
jgi:uncharacterized protein YkwD